MGNVILKLDKYEKTAEPNYSSSKRINASVIRK